MSKDGVFFADSLPRLFGHPRLVMLVELMLQPVERDAVLLVLAAPPSFAPQAVKIIFLSGHSRLLHWFDHRLDKGDFFVRQIVLLVEFIICPRLAEVLERDKSKIRL